jgi:hypothetical protein
MLGSILHHDSHFCESAFGNSLRVVISAANNLRDNFQPGLGTYSIMDDNPQITSTQDGEIKIMRLDA